jgi:hypothetical protein
MTPDQVAALAAPTVDPAQAHKDLQGYGTALTGGLVDKYGQTFGGGKNIDSYLADIRKYDANASLEDQMSSDGTYMGSKLNFDPSKLPKGILEATTGPKGGIELSDPDSHYGIGMGSDSDFRTIDPNLIGSDPIYGSHTSEGNIYQKADGLTDVGTWGPLVMSLVTGGAMAGMLPAFGGLTDAAAQGLVSGATGSGLTAGTGTILGANAGQVINSGFGVARQAGDGGLSAGSLAGLVGQLSGIPGGSTIARAITSLAQGGGLSAGSLAGLLPQIIKLVGSGGR